MARFVPNEPAIFNVVQGRGGPVYRLVRGFTEAAEIGAKFHAPHDTGRLESSIHGDSPNITLGGVESTVKADAKYAFVVHQGRRAIRPVLAPELHFYWKRIGRFINSGDVQSQFVEPRAGRPFLIEGLHEAERAYRGFFKISVKKPWRTEGS